MGKMSELAQTIDDIRKCTEQLSYIADTLSGLFSGKSEDKDSDSVPEPEKPKVPPLTLEKVRAALAEKSRAGFTAEVKALLKKHGADRLSAIDPQKYPALLADAEELTDAT
jgi:hypothetical protein